MLPRSCEGEDAAGVSARRSAAQRLPSGGRGCEPKHASAVGRERTATAGGRPPEPRRPHARATAARSAPATPQTLRTVLQAPGRAPAGRALRAQDAPAARGGRPAPLATRAARAWLCMAPARAPAARQARARRPRARARAGAGLPPPLRRALAAALQPAPPPVQPARSSAREWAALSRHPRPAAAAPGLPPRRG